MIDLHSHILPGIDDGAEDFDASLELVRELCDGGVTDVFATPHYVDETVYVSKRDHNLSLLRQLQEKIEAEKLPIRLHLGNEIYITPRILKLLETGEITTLSQSKYLLVELPMSGDFSGYEDIFLNLIRAGYNVVLAHPERYDSFQKDFALVLRLSEIGVFFQCNLGSFVGQYGKAAMKLARKMAKEKMIFALGSDIHHPRGKDFISKSISKISKYFDEMELDEILVTNPRKILAQ